MSPSFLNLVLRSTDNVIAKNMSNGKDFYVELRKQVTAIQQGVERAGTYISSAETHATPI